MVRTNLDVLIVSPAGTIATGNRVTSERWRAILADLGHDARVAADWEGGPTTSSSSCTPGTGTTPSDASERPTRGRRSSAGSGGPTSSGTPRTRA